MTSIPNLKNLQSEIAQSRSLADDNALVAGEATFNTKYPNFLRDIHQIPLTGNLFNTIVKTLRESPDNDFINRLLEEILQDRLLRQEIYNDPTAKFEINLLRNQGRLKNSFIESAINTPYEDDDDAPGYEPDLLSLGSTDEIVRSQAKIELFKANQESKEAADSFAEAVTEIFELELNSFNDRDPNFKENRSKLEALKVILEDKELRELYKALTISTWLNGGSIDYSAITGEHEEDDGSEHYSESTRMPLIKEDFLRKLYLKYFNEDFDKVFANDPPDADFQATDFIRASELIPAYSNLFQSFPQSKIHSEKFLKSIDSKLLLEWMEEDFDHDVMKEVITTWFKDASVEDKNKVSAKLIRKGILNEEEEYGDDDNVGDIVSNWLKDASQNNNFLLKIIKNKSFPEFISNPFFVNILSNNLKQKTKSGKHLFAHALVAHPEALNQALEKETVKESLVKCLDLKAQDNGLTVKDFLLQKPKSRDIARTYGIVL